MLDIYVRVSNLGNTSITMEMEIYLQDTDTLLTSGRVVYAGYDSNTGATTPVPSAIRRLIEYYEHNGMVLPLEEFPDLASANSGQAARTDEHAG